MIEYFKQPVFFIFQPSILSLSSAAELLLQTDFIKKSCIVQCDTSQHWKDTASISHLIAPTSQLHVLLFTPLYFTNQLSVSLHTDYAHVFSHLHSSCRE